MPKIMIYSHKADIDGVGCIVLAKCAFPNVDFKLCKNVVELEETVREDILNHKLDEYSAIYVTDLALYEPALSMAYNDEDIRKKIVVIDHHQRSIDDGCDKYDFVNVAIRIDGRKTCATELFYRYLFMKNFLRYSESSFNFVEHVRQEDTWEWDDGTSFGKTSHDLSLLFDVKGIDYFIATMVERIKENKDFKMTDEEQKVIDEYKRKINIELGYYRTKIEFFVDEYGNKFGAVFAPYYLRNEIPEMIRKEKMDISYFITVNLDNTKYGQKSYRIVNGGCSLNEIARIHGGGGHKESAHVLITKEQKEKLETIDSPRDALWFIVNESYS